MEKGAKKIKEGEIVDGVVKNITDWGCFIDLNGIDSLLHITDISFSRVDKPSDLISLGQNLRVKITKIDPKTAGKDEIFKIFSNYVSKILKPLEKNLENINQNKPSVILIAGVNGVGKTTTIGKLGKILVQNNKKIVLGAADTFRAAAVSQLEIWAKKIHVNINLHVLLEVPFYFCQSVQPHCFLESDEVYAC